MYEKLNKAEFTAKANQRIELRKQMSEFRKTIFVDVLNKFDGKVYNKRFRDALMKVMPNELWRASEGYNATNEIKIISRINMYNYSDTEELYVKLVLSSNGRINAEETLKNEYTCSWLKNFENSTENIKKAVDNYDEYLATADMIEKLLKYYGDNVPYYFRDNISGFSSYLLK